jgi:hypothetical protein
MEQTDNTKNTPHSVPDNMVGKPLTKRQLEDLKHIAYGFSCAAKIEDANFGVILHALIDEVWAWRSMYAKSERNE